MSIAVTATGDGFCRTLPRLYRGTIEDWINDDQTELDRPDDPDTSVPSYDFGRGQGYYSVSLAAHPTNKDIVLSS